MDESLEDAARRELREETGVQGIFLEQLYTFGDLGRDPRSIISVAYYVLINLIEYLYKPLLMLKTQPGTPLRFAISSF
ncbi:hypothetical protein AM10699_29350 [Acaryochloris marina MBIC10699]|nr:NUDIX domain-containing protein [Acaryochloris marina]BDM80067.1 hypothetical protein AM10699_29350 [Acaryochloris marina MBIC10699]